MDVSLRTVLAALPVDFGSWLVPLLQNGEPKISEYEECECPYLGEATFGAVGDADVFPCDLSPTPIQRQGQ